MPDRFKVTKTTEPGIDSALIANNKDEESALGKLLPANYPEKKGEYTSFRSYNFNYVLGDWI